LSTLRLVVDAQELAQAMGRARLALTCSIDVDQARLWCWFAQRTMPGWRLLVIDSSGEISSRCVGATVIRMVNWYHGRKLDFILRRLSSEFVLICDDDRYVVSDPSEVMPAFHEEKCVVVSLAPRTWWRFDIDGVMHPAMGSYSLLIQRDRFRNLDLRFASPPTSTTSEQIPADGARAPQGFDTADFANLQLLRRGYRVDTSIAPGRFVVGFDAMSSAAIIARLRWNERALRSLRHAPDYPEGSIAGSLARAFYSRASFERLYYDVFGHATRHSVGVSPGTLRSVLTGQAGESEKHEADIVRYMENIDERSATLKRLALRLRSQSG